MDGELALLNQTPITPKNTLIKILIFRRFRKIEKSDYYLSQICLSARASFLKKKIRLSLDEFS